MPNRYHLLSDELSDEIAAASREDQSQWLILSPHEDFIGRWRVDSLWQDFFFDFEEMIGSYRSVSPATLGEFLDACEVMEYKVAFTDDPTLILDEYANLLELPPFEINSTLEGTTKGFFPWQIRGFNKLVRYADEDSKGGLVLWDTGTGKTVFVASAIKWYEMQDEFDLALVIVKSNNKRDMRKKRKKVAGIDYRVIYSYKREKRYDTYIKIEEDLGAGERVVAVTNYEKFRDDEEFFKEVLADRRVLIFWDEMPAKLANRGIQLYVSVRKALYKGGKQIRWKNKRPSWLRQFELTATPIERSPEDQFSCIRMIDPEIFPSGTEWKAEYVATRNYFSKKPETFHNLDKMSLKVEFMSSHVSKEDPEVAKYFPKVIEDTITIDWSERHGKLYDTLAGKAAEMLDGDFEDDNILSLIGAMQMVCDAPSMLVTSAEKRAVSEHAQEIYVDEHETFEGAPPLEGSEVAIKLMEGYRGKITNEGHTKLQTLRELLTEKHPDAKALVFMTWGPMGLPVLSEALTEWGISHVVYQGTQKQKDDAKDRFREDEDIRVFLSSDSGSDGIDLPEAEVMVNYNLPWKYSTKKQRNRHDRATTVHEYLYVYNLMMADSVEDRRDEIIQTKFGYDQGFKGQIAQANVSQSMSKEDLIYLLTG